MRSLSIEMARSRYRIDGGASVRCAVGAGAVVLGGTEAPSLLGVRGRELGAVAVGVLIAGTRGALRRAQRERDARVSRERVLLLALRDDRGEVATLGCGDAREAVQ